MAPRPVLEVSAWTRKGYWKSGFWIGELLSVAFSSAKVCSVDFLWYAFPGQDREGAATEAKFGTKWHTDLTFFSSALGDTFRV